MMIQKDDKLNQPSLVSFRECSETDNERLHTSQITMILPFYICYIILYCLIV